MKAKFRKKIIDVSDQSVSDWIRLNTTKIWGSDAKSDSKKATQKPVNKKVEGAEEDNSLHVESSDSNNLTGMLGNSSESPSLDFSQWYANANDLVTTDTGSTISDKTHSGSETFYSENGFNLSTMGWAALGLIGIGGVAALASGGVTSSNTSSTSSGSSDTNPPVIQSIGAHSESKTIVLTYNEALDGSSLPPTSAFTITTNGVVNTVSSISVSGNVMTLTLADAFTPGALTIAYKDSRESNDFAAIQDASGNDASGFIQGIVADGYIMGAQIYLDLNRNGTADPEEATGIFTGDDGSFFLPSALPNAAIIAVGGINIDTGHEQKTPLKAPAGSSTINPLTTLVQAVIDHAAQEGTILSAQQASNEVASSLGIAIPNGLSLTSYDPLARENANSLAAQKAAAQIQNILNIAAGSDPVTANTIMENLANILVESNSVVQLGSLSIGELNAILSNTAASNSLTIASKISVINSAVEGAPSIAGVSLIQEVVSDTDIRSYNNSPVTTAPLAINLRLANDTGTSKVDRISSEGMIKVPLDYTQNQVSDDPWFYSNDGGANWTTGIADNFTLSPGSYSANSIQVKQFNESGLSTISKIAGAVKIDKVAPTAAALTVDGNGLVSVAIDLSDTSSWSYSKDFGKTWTTASGTATSFSLPAGTYDRGSIVIKQTDLAGNSTITPLDTAVTSDGSTATVPSNPASTDSTAPTLLFTSNINISSPSETKNLILGFNENIDGIYLPAASSFTVSTNGLANNVTNVNILGSNIVLTLADAFSSGSSIISYVDPTTGNDLNALQDKAGNDVASINNRVVDYISPLAPDVANKVLLAFIEDTISKLFDSIGAVNIPQMGSLNLTSIKTAVFEKLQAIVNTGSVSIADFSFNYDATDLTFDMGFQHTFSSENYLKADNASYNYGDTNSIFNTGFTLNGGLNPSLDVKLNFTGGWNNTTQSFYLTETSVTNSLLSGSYISLNADANLVNNTSLSGNFGPLTVAATTVASTDKSDFISTSSNLTSLHGFATVYFKNNSLDPIDIHTGINSQLSLGVTTGLDFQSAVNEFLPSLQFNLYSPINVEYVDGIRTPATTTSAAAYDNAQNNGWVYLDKISIDANDLVSGTVVPLLGFINPIVEDLKPIVDFLNFDVLDYLNNNTPEKDWFGELITNLVDAFNWLPGPDAIPPEPIPTVNGYVADLLKMMYDDIDKQVDTVTVLDLMEGVTGQLNDLLPSLRKISSSTPAAASLLQTISDIVPYLEGTIKVAREISAFLENYYEFESKVNNLENYTLELGTLAFNALTGEIDTSKVTLPWDTTAPATTDANVVGNPLSLNVLNQQVQGPSGATWDQLVDLGNSIGLNIPLLSNKITLANLLLNQEADLITLRPDFSGLISDALAGMNQDIQVVDLFDAASTIPALAFLAPVAKYVDIPIKVLPEITITPRIEAGIDNYALIHRNDSDASIWDSIYIFDNATYANGSLVQDLPEFEADINLMIKAFIGAGIEDFFYADVGAGVGIESSWSLDLEDPNMDGKVRGAELWNMPDFAGNADFLVKLYSNLDTYWGDKNYTYTPINVNIFDFNTAPVIPA